MTKHLSILLAGEADPGYYRPFLLRSFASFIIQRITSIDNAHQMDYAIEGKALLR